MNFSTTLKAFGFSALVLMSASAFASGASKPGANDGTMEPGLWTNAVYCNPNETHAPYAHQAQSNGDFAAALRLEETAPYIANQTLNLGLKVEAARCVKRNNELQWVFDEAEYGNIVQLSRFKGGFNVQSQEATFDSSKWAGTAFPLEKLLTTKEFAQWKNGQEVGVSLLMNYWLDNQFGLLFLDSWFSNSQDGQRYNHTTNRWVRKLNIESLWNFRIRGDAVGITINDKN